MRLDLTRRVAASVSLSIKYSSCNLVITHAIWPNISNHQPIAFSSSVVIIIIITQFVVLSLSPCLMGFGSLINFLFAADHGLCVFAEQCKTMMVVCTLHIPGDLQVELAAYFASSMVTTISVAQSHQRGDTESKPVARGGD